MLTLTRIRRMDTDRRASLAAGLLYIGTFVFSIPALWLYAGVVDDRDFVVGAGADAPVMWGALGEVLTALTGIGTAVALYPVLRRYGPSRAVGFVASRTLEAAMILTGVVAVLAVVTLRQDLAGAAGGDGAALTTAAAALVAVREWTFLLGPGVMATVNALLFATLVHRFRLAPRWIPTLGLIGAPLLAASSTATLFGLWEQVSAPAMLMVLPIAVWEFSIGVYMTARGLRTVPAPAPAHPSVPVALAHA